MGSEYTPDTEEVREDFTCAVFEGIPSRGAIEDANFEWNRRAAQFDRWLAEHDRQVAEVAWDEGFLLSTRNSPTQPHPMLERNPHRKESE